MLIFFLNQIFNVFLYVFLCVLCLVCGFETFFIIVSLIIYIISTQKKKKNSTLCIFYIFSIFNKNIFFLENT